MSAYKTVTLIVISVLVAILLASALSSFTRVSDSALADNSLLLQGGGRVGDGGNAPRAAPGKNYLPIIFLNSATAGGAWLLSGNAGTVDGVNFLGTTDKVTLTLGVSNTVAFRIVPAVDGFGNIVPNIIGGFSGNAVAPGIGSATIAGGGVSGHPNVITGTGDYPTIGGGIGNTASNGYATVGGGYDNTASGDTATVGGGQSNIASGWMATVGGGQINTANGYIVTIGGGLSNTASGDIATIGGGFGNTASDVYATVGGGYNNNASGAGAFVGGGGYNGSTLNGNQAQGDASTISGGYGNVISSTASYAFIGGGDSNTASNLYATVGGGVSNTAIGYGATIGGGLSNTASGLYATIPGGVHNVAQGDYSFAAGYKAHAYHRGSFVWSDSTGLADSTANDQFLVHAQGGIYLYPLSGSCILTTGAGGWSCSSDRNLKENFQAVDAKAVLQALSQIPVLRWNSKGQEASVQHIGPMAQDFYAAFKVGDDNLHINTVDAQGVALAAIQGLYQENQDLKAQVANLQSQNDAQQKVNASLDARLTAIEQANGIQSPNPLQGEGASAFALNNLPLWGIVGLLALWLVRRRK